MRSWETEPANRCKRCLGRRSDNLVLESAAMPADYEIDVEHRIVRVRCWGDVTFAELIEGRVRLVNDPAFKPDFSVMFDCLEVPRSVLTTAQVQEFASHIPLGRGSRVAIVIAHTASLGLARMFQILREVNRGQEQVHIFTNREEAETWLRLRDSSK